MKAQKIVISVLVALATVICGVFSLDKEWWKHASIYEIYLRSFKDSDGDGIGDIQGLISKLDYLVEIGVDTIYMTPFYPSAMADGGYDVTDYKGIYHEYGTMDDFDQLMKEIKSRDLYFIMDLVINHSSDEHEWFQKSIDKIDPYTNYYVWADPKGYDWNGTAIPPNNWFSVFTLMQEGTAWIWNEKRKQFYLHQCHPRQPDFNLRNEAVKKEIQDIMTFWLDKGVSGFRVDAPMMFMEDEQLRDNPPLKSIVTAWTVFEECERTINHPESYKFVNELNVFLRKYDRESGKPIQTALLGETYGPINQVVKYYGTKKFPAFHIPFNFLLQFLTTYQNARGLHDYLHTWLDKVPKGMTSNWVMGNHDQGRIAGNLNSEYNYILLAITTMLPGASTVYYGEELGLAANKLVSIKDIYNRFSHRTPMQWDDSRNAGFSTAEKPWTPLHPNYWHMNVQTQRTDINSTLNYFKDLMSLRKTDTMIYGDLKFYIISEWVLAFSRASKQTGYIIVMNLGTETEPMDWPIEMNHFSITLTVVASSPNSGYKKGFKIKTRGNYPLTSVLRPHSIVILSSSDIH
ncbi:maltase 1-like [Planococcus citri]|uniref:maltase 1-like n=1 Tax=Planococcus citri TaxID=170843 RepID=UPI0031F7A792